MTQRAGYGAVVPYPAFLYDRRQLTMHDIYDIIIILLIVITLGAERQRADI